jgi:predicted transcriptional regulator
MAKSIKQAALTVIGQMPDDASLEDIMYELYFRQRIDRGLRELEEGKTVSHEEVKRSLVRWLFP